MRKNSPPGSGPALVCRWAGGIAGATTACRMAVAVEAWVHNDTTDDPQKVLPSSICSYTASPPLRALLFLRLRRHADHLHTGAARRIHREDHVLILHGRVALHEYDLLRTILVDVVDPLEERVLRIGRLVDRVLFVGEYFQHYLLVFDVFGLRRRIGIRHLHVGPLPPQGYDHDKDEKQ